MSIVEKDSTGAVTDERLFIWAGLSILQERDGNNTITKNHFANGFENLSSGTQYYYTKDHLGSIREVTDSTGTLVASYDYTPYGTRTLTSGSDISDFGYTGHFTHAKSGLLLAPYRAYDPQLGRWLSRDPIQEGDGPNLYAYVHNDPINYYDPFGLYDYTYKIDRGGHGLMPGGQNIPTDPHIDVFNKNRKVGRINLDGTIREGSEITRIPKKDKNIVQGLLKKLKTQLESIHRGGKAPQPKPGTKCKVPKGGKIPKGGGITPKPVGGSGLFIIWPIPFWLFDEFMPPDDPFENMA